MRKLLTLLFLAVFFSATSQEYYEVHGKTLTDKGKRQVRHKPMRIMASFNTEFLDYDVSEFDHSYTLQLDIPLFSITQNLFIGIGGMANVNYFDKDESDDFNGVGIYAYYGHLNYSIKITRGLYLVPQVGYGILGFISELEDFEEFEDVNSIDDFDNALDYINNDSNAELYYGAFLDFSFNGKPKGFGLTAGYSRFSNFSFGIQFGF